MKNALILIATLFSCFISKAQNNLPAFHDKPVYFDSKTKQIKELEKSQYNTIAKAKGLFSAESGFFLNGISSNIKIPKQEELIFIVKVIPGTDPTSVFDLVQFEVRKDQRVFITSKAKATSSTTSFERINYEVKKLKMDIII